MESTEKTVGQNPKFEADKEGFVNFGEVSRQLLRKQAQYGSRYVDGFFGVDDYPKLGEGLRIKGNSDNYHEMKIHRDDIEEFIRRYKDYQSKQNY